MTGGSPQKSNMYNYGEIGLNDVGQLKMAIDKKAAKCREANGRKKAKRTRGSARRSSRVGL